MRENNRNRCVYARFYEGLFSHHPTGEGQKELASISICRETLSRLKKCAKI